MFLAEALERRTKKPGRRNGQLGYIGLTILRALVLHFQNRQSGALYPSYSALERHTGLCRQSVARGIARLERCGVLRVVRRLVRQYVTRRSPITGQPETILTTTQASNLYAVHEPGAWADHLALPIGRRAPFPSRRQLDLLERMALTWRSRLSLEPSARHREEPHPTVASLIASEYRGPKGDAESA